MILLDTAAWIWHANESADLPATAITILEREEPKLVSAISVWELGMLVAKQRLRLDRPIDSWVEQALRLPGVEPVPVEPEIALLATRLPGDPPQDPADRLIIATGLVHGCPILTPDRRLQGYPFVPTRW